MNKAMAERIDRRLLVLEQLYPGTNRVFADRDGEWSLPHLRRDIQAALSSLPVRSGEVERLRACIEECRRTFAYYADQHRLKRTAEGDVKAARNRELADMCRAALATPQQVKEGGR